MQSVYQQIYHKMQELGQEHVFAFWPQLNESQRQDLLQQLQTLDLAFVEKQLQRRWPVGEDAHQDLADFKPSPYLPLPRTRKEISQRNRAIQEGEALLRRGQAGIIVVAGGQGTRLGFDGPKGTFAVGPVTQRTLFQYHVEKIRALERLYNCTIPFYVMTSPGNHQATIRYFAEHQFFGKNPDSVIFFPQRLLPVFDEHGKILLESKHRLSFSPDGHGGLLYALKKHHIVADMVNRGIRHIYYFQVDNVLIKMCDPAFMGEHVLARADMSARTVYKRDPEEPLGNIGLIGDIYRVIEYTELPPKLKEARDQHGTLVYGQGSIAIHMFAVDFLQRMTSAGHELPYHLAHKAMPFVDAAGVTCKPAQKNALKFEQFIFDAFSHAQRVMVQETERDQDFSPIKNASGPDSPETARRDLNLLFASWLEACGVKIPRHDSGIPRHNLEISPLFALSPGQLSDKIPSHLDLDGDLLLE